ncbi:hypothetical protein GCM10027563_30810 [Parasphingorhabdus pacifica]
MTHRHVSPTLLAGVLLASLLVTIGCGFTGDPPGTRCEERVRTAAGIQESVYIVSENVECENAVRVMDDYYRTLERGEGPGAGGRGPVSVGAWTCSHGPVTNPGTTCSTEDGRVIEGETQK